MSKYYVLMESSCGDWGIKTSSGAVLAVHSDTETILEYTIRSYRANNDLYMNYSNNFAKEIKKDIKKDIVYGGMSYYKALESVRTLKKIQEEDLRHVKDKYRKAHTVSIHIVSRSKAISKLGDTHQSRHYDGVDISKLNNHSVEYRRLVKRTRYNHRKIYK